MLVSDGKCQLSAIERSDVQRDSSHEGRQSLDELWDAVKLTVGKFCGISSCVYHDFMDDDINDLSKVHTIQ